MRHSEGEKTQINRKVRIKDCAKIFQGETGIATMVTDCLYFYVTLGRAGWESGLWFDFNELEFLND